MTRKPLTMAVVGCTHGELLSIYQTIKQMEIKQSIKVDVLICCGDFQAARSITDLRCMNCPPKYQQLGTFQSFFNQSVYSDKSINPPITDIPLTIYIGGNHECSHLHRELSLGGFVAANIYYAGYSNVLSVNGWRLAFFSGIFNQAHYQSGCFETFPLNQSTIRSIYHQREFHSWQLTKLVDCEPLTENELKGKYEIPHDQSDKQSAENTADVSSKSINQSINQSVSQQATNPHKVDVLFTHDWPRGVAQHGNIPALLRRKSFLAEEIESDTLGSPLGAELIMQLKPRYAFAGHMHVKFAALVKHDTNTPTHHSITPTTQANQSINQSHKRSNYRDRRKVIETLPTLASLSNSHSKKQSINQPTNPSIKKETKQSTESNGQADESTNQSINQSSNDQSLQSVVTKFLALDKAVPGRHFMQILTLSDEIENQRSFTVPILPHADVSVKIEPIDTNNESQSMTDDSSSISIDSTYSPPSFEFDLDWLSIVQNTTTFLSTTSHKYKASLAGKYAQCGSTASQRARLMNRLINQTTDPIDADHALDIRRTYTVPTPAEAQKLIDELDAMKTEQPSIKQNPQTKQICDLLNIVDVYVERIVQTNNQTEEKKSAPVIMQPRTIAYYAPMQSSNPDEIDIGDM